MRILHIMAMSPLSPNSGIPAVLKQLSDAQNKVNGLESEVLSLRGTVEGIDSSHFVYLGNESVSSFISDYRPDVAIFHSFFYTAYVKAARILTEKRIPFFIEPHGSFGRQALKKSRAKKLLANHTVFRHQIKGSRGYIFTNKAEQDDSVYHTDHDLIIPNGVLPEIVYGAERKSKDSFAVPSFYYLGRFDIHHKGLDYLFDALDVLEQEGHVIQMNLFGTGTDKQIEYVNKRIENYRNLKVKNCGVIYGAEKKRALENCNILLLTSRYEGSPMTVLDGFSYGNPCIVTPGTNVSEEVEENRLGWRTELNPEAIADSIKLAERMYCEEGQEYYDRCQNYILERYCWDKIAEYSLEALKMQL